MAGGSRVESFWKLALKIFWGPKSRRRKKIKKPWVGKNHVGGTEKSLRIHASNLPTAPQVVINERSLRVGIEKFSRKVK